MIPTLLFSGFFFANAFAIPLAGHEQQQQQPLGNGVSSSTAHSAGGVQRLTGRFLHITDPHPDSHYKQGASADNNCHRGHGSAGYFGADGTDCDAPFTLMNATFRWIERNLKGNIDFVLWTGDSARHDRDEKVPRKMEEIIHLNEILSQQFIDVFQDSIPVVPTIGNNDIMPHNTMKEGPNRWTKTLVDAWGKFIPESKRHSFVEGGWFTSEVIPGKLSVISLNTMYFYSSNSAVDGCDDKDEPGYEHMEWLRVQLKLLRQRQMKAILIGHVPPARAGSKQGWDETCWQKYTLWLHQYRDVIVGSVYGHMNIDHFMFQDSHDIDIVDLEGDNTGSNDFSVQSMEDYLEALRGQWSDMPSPPSGLSIVEYLDEDFAETDGNATWTDISKKRKKKKKKFLRKIGGPLAERYSVSLVSPSLVPEYFPTLRVIEYNITGLEDTPTWSDIQENTELSYPHDHDTPSVLGSEHSPMVDIDEKKKKKKMPKFKVPEPPPSSALPGPGYSNQPLSWLGYTQYYANLTRINDKVALLHYRDETGNNANATGVDEVFDFEVEYDTRTDHVYKMKDLTVRSLFDLASRIANNIPNTLESHADTNDDEYDNQKKKKKKKKKGKKKNKNKTWKTFLNRAFVGYLDINDLEETES